MRSAVGFVDLLAERVPLRTAGGPEFGTGPHQVIVALDHHEPSEPTLQASGVGSPPQPALIAPGELVRVEPGFPRDI